MGQFERECKIARTLRVMPAMQAGIADQVWTIDEVVDLLRNELLD